MIFPWFVMYFVYLDQSIIVLERKLLVKNRVGGTEGNGGVALKKNNIHLLTFQLVQQEKDESELLREREPPCAPKVKLNPRFVP